MNIALVLPAIILAALAAAPHRDGVVIHNSGSTNSYGYTIAVWSNGDARVEMSSRTAVPASPPRAASVPKALAERLIADAQQAKRERPAAVHCMKSASFGTTETILYHGWQSPDVTCSSGALVQRLHADAESIVQALHLPLFGRGVPMLPGIRRPMPAARTPEPAPSAS